ncbi:MAG TPA: hypothetical protein VGO67_18815 [Verrucomicrobiae bacterium]
MKLKIKLLIGVLVFIAATVVVLIRQPSRHSVENELPTVTSNYQKTFKLDTSPAIFPDGKSTNLSSKTNAANP